MAGLACQGEETVPEIGFRRQAVLIPTSVQAWQAWPQWLFADLDQNKLDDLLVVCPLEHRLHIYRQKTTRFSEKPDQSLEIPPETAWISPCDVEARPGLELVLAIPTGILYWRQNGGVFESPPLPLITDAQVFTNVLAPVLRSLASPQPPAKGAKGRANMPGTGTSGSIPVISADHAVLYERNNAFEWRPGLTLPLHPAQARWNVESGEWMMGAARARTLSTRQVLSTGPQKDSPGLRKRADNPAVEKIIEEVENDDSVMQRGTEWQDINGDGLEDLVVWQIAGALDPKTDLFVFVRGAGGALPDRPSEVLHCRGFPIPVGSPFAVSPLCDLDGDGIPELVLLTPKITALSSSGIAEAILSRGMDWGLAIRTASGGVFSKSRDATIKLRTPLPTETGVQRCLLLEGDFNGDGRTDLLVQRSASMWDVLFSTTGGDWFERQPGATFEMPGEADIEIRDFNHDGLSDLIVRSFDDSRLTIFLKTPKP